MKFEYPLLEDLFSLQKKVAVVIGGDGHLGTPMCEALAEAGARLAIASNNEQGCRQLAERLGRDHIPIYLDCHDEAMIRDTIDHIAETTGSIDVLVNMASSGPPRWRVEDVTADDFAEALRIGCTGYFVASRQAAQYMKDAGGGSIINVASMYGIVSSYPHVYDGLDTGGQPPWYQAAKAGVLQLTRHLATYWADDGIRVNSISPGPFPRPRVHEEMPQLIERLQQKVPLKRMGKNWELKGAVVFCASDASSYMTGHNLVIDGGWTIW